METQPTNWRLDAGQIEVVDEAVAAILRQKAPWERIAIAIDAHRTVRQMLTAQIGSMHPDWTSEQVVREVARRMTRGAS